MEGEQVLGGRYRLHDRIGEGGMAVVWRATDEVLRRPVAVKVLSGKVRNDAAARLRIQAEARAAAKLAHPCVASVYDYGESPGADGEPVPFVVMELLDGPTLSKRLSGGPLPPAEALRVCAEVASGLAAAHDAGLVHRDVKPANVMLTPAGAKVVDFGIAAAAGPLDDPEDESSMFGTPAYLAPERLVGGDVLAASDVYALGLLLHAALVGRLPWDAETTTQMLAAHVYVQPSPLPRIAGVPAPVAEIYRRCLAKNPADRPSAHEVAKVLAAGLAAVPAGTAASHRRRNAVFVVAGGGAVVVATVLALLLDSGTTGPGTTADAQVSGTATPSPGVAGTATGSPGTHPRPSGTSGPGGGATGTDGQGAPISPPSARTSAPAGPGGPGDPETPASPTKPVETTTVPASPVGTQQRTLTSAGGSVVAECAGDQAKLVDWTPASGYKVQNTQQGPAKQVRVFFKGPTNDQVKIRCEGGVPTRA